MAQSAWFQTIHVVGRVEGNVRMTYLRSAGLNYKQFSAYQGQVENRHFGNTEKGQKDKSWRNFIVYILFIISIPTVVLFHNHFRYPIYNLLQWFVHHESFCYSSGFKIWKWFLALRTVFINFCCIYSLWIHWNFIPLRQYTMSACFSLCFTFTYITR